MRHFKQNCNAVWLKIKSIPRFFGIVLFEWSRGLRSSSTTLIFAFVHEKRSKNMLEKNHWLSDSADEVQECFQLILACMNDRQIILRFCQGVTKRCRLSCLTNSALIYIWAQMGGRGGSQPMTASVHRGAQINFGLGDQLNGFKRRRRLHVVYPGNIFFHLRHIQ